jgi:hypothetical protein
MKRSRFTQEQARARAGDGGSMPEARHSQATFYRTPSLSSRNTARLHSPRDETWGATSLVPSPSRRLRTLKRSSSFFRFDEAYHQEKLERSELVVVLIMKRLMVVRYSAQ